MKRVLVFVLLFTFVSAYSQFVEENLDRELYRANKVKAVKIYESRYRNGAAGRREKIDDYKAIDTLGRITESISYDGKDYRQLFNYDSAGNVSEHITFILQNEAYSTPFTYELDGKGRIAAVKKREHEQWIFSYDSTDNIIAQKWISNDDYPQSFLLDSFQYNSKKQMIKMTRYWSGMQLYFYKTFGYDDAGNKISEVRFQNGEMTDTWEYYYDGNHHKTGWAHYGSKMEKTYGTYLVNEYDQNGLLLSSVVGKRYRRYVYEFY